MTGGHKLNTIAVSQFAVKTADEQSVRTVDPGRGTKQSKRAE